VDARKSAQLAEPLYLTVNVELFLILINKLHNCVNQLEQFAVRVHDVPNSVGCGKNAIKFFNTHQLKCLLQRHPSVPSSSSSSSSGLRQWKGGHVKVDPLALVGTIEKYLLMRGIHKPPTSASLSAATTSNTASANATAVAATSQAAKISNTAVANLLAPSVKSSRAAGLTKMTTTTAAITTTLNVKTTTTKPKSKSPVSRTTGSLFKLEAPKPKTDSKKPKTKTAAFSLTVNKKEEPKKKTATASKSLTVKPTAGHQNEVKSKKNKKSNTLAASSGSTGKRKATSKPEDMEDEHQKALAMLHEETEEDMHEDEQLTTTRQHTTADETFDEDDQEYHHDDDDEDDNEEDDNEFDDQIFESELMDEDEDDEELEEEEEEEDVEEDEEGDETTTVSATTAASTAAVMNVHATPIIQPLQSDDDNSRRHDDEDNEDDLDDEDEDEDDEDDIESAMNAILGTSSAVGGSSAGAASGTGSRYTFKHYGQINPQYLPKLELLIDNHVLPSNMTIYQAIKQYSMSNENQTVNAGISYLDVENDMESTFLNNAIWSKLHVIHYRLAQTSEPTLATMTATTVRNSDNNNNTTTTSSKRTTRQQKSTAAASSSKKTTASASVGEECKAALAVSNINTNEIDKTQLFNSLNETWQSRTDAIRSDKSIESLNLLYLLSLLNRNWPLLYHDWLNPKTHNQAANNSFQLVNSSEFLNSKLTAKANRQLQDPLVVMTGHLPKWLPDLMQTCQFLFPFETRLMYFYITALDRDRAMQKLIDLNADLAATNQSDANSSNSHNERIKPRLEKKKKYVNRGLDLIKQADSILNEFCVNVVTTKQLSSASASSSSGARTSTAAAAAQTQAAASSSTSSSKPALLEIQYDNEVGTGLGPTLEFYALVSLELQKCSHEMWRGEKVKLNTLGDRNAAGADLYFHSATGLFPAPVSLLLKGRTSSKQQGHVNKLKSKFKFLGKFMAKAIMDFRLLDLQLSSTFYKLVVDPASVCEQDLAWVDASLYSSIESLRDYQRKRRLYLLELTSGGSTSETEKRLVDLERAVADLDLDFTLPGYAQIELKKNGKDTLVSMENLDEYVDLIVEWSLVKGVEQQLEGFREGFESILPLSCLKLFYSEELDKLVCGTGYAKWDVKTLVECTRCDHGYTHDSKAVQNLFEIMCAFDADEQRLFLQFITGSPRLPIGGLRSLVPPLTIVRKTADSSSAALTASTKTSAGTCIVATADDYLPSVMTCVNYLKLPEYSSLNVMKSKLVKAMKDGQLSFHLS
jgi:hypothetical protein